MKNQTINPFVTGGYVSPDYFCDRTNETKRILTAISSRRNLTLISLRRMGKTGLLNHVRHQLEHSGEKCSVIYIDLLPTTNANEMLNTLSSALIRYRKNEQNFLEKFLSIIATLRPRVTYDSLTGQPALELKVETQAEIRSGLSYILEKISEIRNKIVIMFDEFQQINNYPEKNIEHLLRTVFQSYPGIAFIFSGSSKHMLERMFLSAGSPFYQSSELMYLDRINENEYSEFITGQFYKSNKSISTPALEQLFQLTRGHTWYMQYCCSHLFEGEEPTIDKQEVNQTLNTILNEFEPLYVTYRNLIPGHQFRLLQAIAVEDGVSQPTSGTFISKHYLKSASSVATSLKALSEKEMIVYDQNKWLVYDVFFSRWLEYHFKRQVE
jgi:AAA+ ATPase superfamily predicted ATPase